MAASAGEVTFGEPHAEGERAPGAFRRRAALPLVCKRLFDVVVALALVVLLAPVLALIALLILLDTSGPIFFVHERIGARWRLRNGHVGWEPRRFRFYKFRSMVANADDAVHRAHIEAFVQGRKADNARPGAAFKLAGDPRITRVGAILRRSSLDELPQLFNVLKGDMSLVGPRPVPEYEVECYGPSDWERLNALPGITGLWQVNGRADVTFAEMIELDVEYVRARSLLLDLKILARTIPAVVGGRGAG
jgi:exopolysaccharide production protein ExoY